MASVAEHSARRSSNCFAASQPPIPSLELNEHRVPNEEAVASDGSLSQNCTHGPRSTPASSFSIQRGSPSTEVQSSSLGHGEDIELSSLPNHRDPDESYGNHILPSVPEEDSHQHDLPAVIADQDAPTNASQPPNRQRTYPTSLRESLRTVQRYVPSYEIFSATVTLIAAVLTLFFGYQAWQLTRISTKAQLREACIGEEEKGQQICEKILDSPIGSPYATRDENTPELEGVTERLSGSSAVAPPSNTIHPVISHRFFIFLGLVIGICLLISSFRALLLDGRCFQPFRNWWKRCRNRPNAFDSVQVRLTHPQSRGIGSESNQRGGRRRIIHGIQEQSHEEYERTRKRSFQPNLEKFHNVPFWRRRSLGRLEGSQPKPVSVQVASIGSVASQVGDALKGNAPDDLILSPGSAAEKCRRVLQKTYSLFHDSDSEDVEPPLTALLADVEPEEELKRKVAIHSGVVALGLVQAGSTLASSVGVGVGPEILVKSESIERMDKMTPTPLLAHETFTTGFEHE